jgi:hypothetical protein
VGDGTAIAKPKCRSIIWGDSALIRKQLALLTSVALIAITVTFPGAISAQTTTDAAANKARFEVQKISSNRGQKVEIKLRDSSKIKGYISEVAQDNFVVSDPKTGASQTLSYAEVSSVKKASGSSIKPWLILGAVAAGVGITWAIVKPAVCDGGAQTRGIC